MVARCGCDAEPCKTADKRDTRSSLLKVMAWPTGKSSQNLQNTKDPVN